jgi:hypothetical protein
MVLNKTDLLPHLDFDVRAASTTRAASTRRSRCCWCRRRAATGMDAWLDWLLHVPRSRRPKTAQRPRRNDRIAAKPLAAAEVP